MTLHAEEIITAESCPDRVKPGICKNCIYYDYCWFADE